MKKIFIIASLIIFNYSNAQTGVNTDDPKATLHVKLDSSATDIAPGIISPLLTGNQLKAKDNLYQSAHIGAIVYVSEAANPTSNKTVHVVREGYYYFDGTVWRGFEADKQSEDDATRFLGGTVYVYMDGNLPSNAEMLANEFVIGGGNNHNYTIGTLSEVSNKGRIKNLRGNGYTISNTYSGIFDIKFDLPLDEIYGISVNIYDTYASGSNDPNPATPGTSLNTNDNAQVAYISNGIIRIKTGNDGGQLANRSFTFLVTGK